MGAPNNNTPSMSSTRFPSHQLSNGLYVSGLPDQYKDKVPTMSVSQMPYTGGDIKKSGELGKMFDIPVEISSSSKLRKSGSTSASHSKAVCPGASSSHSGPLPSLDCVQAATTPVGGLSTNNYWRSSKSGPSVSKSGPLMGTALSIFTQSSKSGPLTRSGANDSTLSSSTNHLVPGTNFTASAAGLPTSGSASISGSKTFGQLPPTIPATGLITSGPISSSPLNPAGLPRKGQSASLESSGQSGKHSSACGNSQAVNNLSLDQEYSFKRSFPRVILWTVVPLFIMGFIAGAFIIAAVQNAVLLIVVAGLFVAVTTLLVWNTCWGRKTVSSFLGEYPHSELVSAKDGQYVKVTGVVTCGSVPLESSYLKVNRCIYTSTGLYEYRSFFSKPVRETHQCFTWGARHVERHVVDFYISDLQSGLRALVKAGFGARLIPEVKETAVVDVTPRSKDVSSEFLRWVSERNLFTGGERRMRLKEGYIKEGSTVTVFGVVQRQENVLMIIPPPEAVSTGCQWWKLLLPATLEGLILVSADSERNEGVPL